MSELGSPRKQSEVSSLKGAEPKTKPKGKGTKGNKHPVKVLPFFEPDEFSDVTIIVGEKRLYSNKCLLSYNSPIFAKQLADGGTEGKGKNKTVASKELDLSEKKYEEVCELLAFIDPRVDVTLKDDDAFRLIPMAHEFEIAPLLKACEFTVTQSFYKMRKGKRSGSVPIDVCIQYLIVADKHKFKDLLEMCMEECVSNDNPFTNKNISESSSLSEGVKVHILERKLDKVNMILAKERRTKVEKQQIKDTRGSKIWTK